MGELSRRECNGDGSGFVNQSDGSGFESLTLLFLAVELELAI